MKKFLLILLFPSLCYVQAPVVPVGTGEYDCYFINSSGKLYHLDASLPAAMNVPSNLTWKYVAGGLHNGAAIDNLGHLWTLGDNSAGVAGNGSTAGTGNPSQVLRDSSGRVFDSVVAVTLWYNAGTGILAVKSTGTLWIWGNLAGNMRGNGASGGTWTRPVRVVIPGNRKVVKVCANNIVQVLCSDGTVWTWGGTMKEILGSNSADYSHPHQVILPQAAKDIASGGLWSYAVGWDGTLYGWGLYTNSMFGTYKGYYIITTPLDLKKYMGFALPVSKVFTNSVASYFILTDGSLWSCGDNVVGSLGNGKQADQSKGATPYATWPDPAGAQGQLLQPVPTRIGPAGAKFVNVYVATPCVFYFYAQDANGQLYSAGRNKGGVLGNGVRECDYVQGLIGSQRPNSWNVPLLTAVNPMGLRAATSATSPFCQMGSNQKNSPCNLCAVQPSTPTGQPIPGTIQAEGFSAMYGIATQLTLDLTGLLNVGWIDAGDWMDYNVTVGAAGKYTVNFRVATPYPGAGFQLKSGSGAVLATMKLSPTGNFQKWQTVSATVSLSAGYQTLRLYSNLSPRWNINWMQFTLASAGAQAMAAMESGQELSVPSDTISDMKYVAPASFTLYPNPVKNEFSLQLDNMYIGNMIVQVIDVSGAERRRYKFNKDQSAILVNLSTGDLAAGAYFVRVQIGAWSDTRKMTKL